MQEDEDMITIMDSDRFIDSIRLLTCKYRIMNSNADWLSNFCTSGGISVLVENMDNRLDKVRRNNSFYFFFLILFDFLTLFLINFNLINSNQIHSINLINSIQINK